MKKIAIIGLGLIGGSIAKALKKSNEAGNYFIAAYDLPQIISQALAEGVADKKLETVEDAATYDIIFLALPLSESIDCFDKLAGILHGGTILSDVCGVKGIFEHKWNHLESSGIYMGGHPMTGKERGGYENSDPLLFENSVYILSSRSKGRPESHELLGIIKCLGARAVFLDPFVHDKVVANVSHIPQLLAVALVNSAFENNSENINNLDFAAGGFRDMTRIASSSFSIWKDVISTNKSEILYTLEKLQYQIGLLKSSILLDDQKKLEESFLKSAQRRDSIPKTNKGFINPVYDLFVYVKDEPGVISKISTLLFSNGINIKDIELLKIREGSGGTFRLSFESLKDADSASGILKNAGYEFQ
jgi:prephenate dehydrogenase